MYRYLLLTLTACSLSLLSFAQNCPASLVGGTATATSNPVCPTQYFSVNVSGSSTGAGITWQWEQSFDNVSWSAIPGATLEYLPSLKIDVKRYYRRKIICGTSIEYSSAVQVDVKPFNDCYCTPGISSCSNGYQISNVTVGSINNTSSCSASAYTNYSGTIAAANVTRGTYLPVSVTVASTGPSRYVHVVVDFNQNGEFESKEHTILYTPSASVYSGSIKIPFNAKTGTTRMRVIYTAGIDFVSCFPGVYSESEDYLLNITPNNTGAAGFVIYVKPSGAGNGSSWLNAMNSVRSAMAAATEGDTIKVAAGTYNGGQRTDGIMLVDSVTLLGGYPATGTPTDAQRDHKRNLTILNGGVYAPPVDADFHVISATGPIKNALVDGFIIQGGGAYSGSSPGQVAGAGIGISLNAEVKIQNCVFRNNGLYSPGSAISVYDAKATFTNCIITSQDSYYGTILLQKNSEVEFNNVLVARNTGTGLLQTDSSIVRFRNSTIANNVHTGYTITANNLSQLSFANSINYYNGFYNVSWQTTSFDSTEIRLDNSTLNISHSLSQIAETGSNLLMGVSPKFRDTSSIAGPDGFYFTADDGYSLQNPCSPALNAGNNSLATGITTDITGQSRQFGVVDLGAYESQQTRAPVPSTIYVNATATGLNNGTSWANAYTDLHKAFASCSDTIKIAAGVYEPWKTASGAYWMENNRVVMGGYPATGNPTDADRDPSLHLTKIDGSQPNTAIQATTVLRGTRLDSTAVLDGLYFTRSGRGIWFTEGALTYTNSNNPIIRNCTFSGNSNRVFWGNKNKDPLLINCSFSNNTTFDNSYGLDLVVLSNSEKTTFRKCKFEGNKLPTYTGIVGEFGRVLRLDNTNAVMDSCLFARNGATVMVNTDSDPKVTNTTFLNNYASDQTTDLKNIHSDPVFTNCIFRDSAWSYFSPERGGIMNNFASNPVFLDCQFYNGNTYKMGGLAFNDSSDARFVNCVFSNNTNAFFNIRSSDIELTNCISTGSKWSVYGAGGGTFMYNAGSSPTITNCVITNSQSEQHGVMVNDLGSFPKIYNTIFWKNFSRYGTYSVNPYLRTEIINLGDAMPVIKNSSFELYDAGGTDNNTTNVDPRFENYQYPMGADSIWFTADDGLRLCDCSPAINSGNNSYAASTDLTKLPRIFGGTVDRGAYERQTAPSPTYKTSYVSSAANGSNNGSTWANAYNNLQSAINNPCTDTIKIAAGMYKPAVTARDSGFYIGRNLVMLGSFTHNTNVQNVDVTPTIISGDVGIPGDSTDNSFGLIHAEYFDTLLIDGVVLQGTNRNIQGSIGYSSALNVQHLQYLSVKNSRLINNSTNTQGGGANVRHVKNFDIQKTVFAGNKAIWGGGLKIGENQAAKRITDCVFENNEGSEGGGVHVGTDGGTFVNVLFTGNKAFRGGGMLISNNANMLIANCTFYNNRLVLGGNYGAGIYSTGASWQGPDIGPHIRNSIFKGNTWFNQALDHQSIFLDLYHPKNGYHPDNNVAFRIHHSAVSTPPEYYYGGGLLNPYSIQFKNKTNPVGPDGRWFTDDDGLQLTVCSDGIDDGFNAAVTTDKDIAGNPRIFNTTVDLGAYEYGGEPIWAGVLSKANDSVAANKEITDTLGWTHYYKDCFYLMSIKKAGQNIGTVGDGTFELKIVTGPNYNTGTAMNLTGATYNTSGLPWFVMNRYWRVNATNPVTDSMLVRFPYSTSDFNDVKGSDPTVTAHTDLDFFKVSGTGNPFDLNVSSSNFFRYAHAEMPSTTNWTYSQQDTIHLADYYIKSFSGGGGGSRAPGPLAELTITAAGVNSTNVTGGSTVVASFTEANGGGIAGSHKVNFYFSADNIFTPGANGDILIGDHSIAMLAAGANTGTINKTLIVPCGHPAGNYYLFFVADGNDNVPEASETNNYSSVGLTVTAGLSAPTVPVITTTGTPCYGNTVILTAASSGCVGCVYTWSNGTTGATTNVTTNGTYTVTATNNCGSVTSSTVVTFRSGPNVVVTGGPNSLCSGSTLTMNASGADSYTWSGEGLSDTTGSSVTAIPTTPGQARYTVIGTLDGCSTSRLILINVYPKPVMTVTPAEAIICAGGSVTLNLSGTMEAVTWSPATGLNTPYGWTVVASPATTTTYKIVGSSIYGCKDSINKTVTVSPPVTPSVTINYTGCPGRNLVFTATPVNSGAAPTYEWYLNNVKQASTTNTFQINNAVNGMEVFAVVIASGCVTANRDTSNTEIVNCIVTSLPSIDALESFKVSPNPSSGPVTIEMKLRSAKLVSFEVSDGNGKRIYESVPEKMSGDVTREIDLRNVAAGVYFLRTKIGTESFVEKIVVVR